MTTKNTKKNKLTVRLADAKTLSLFNELLATKIFDSQNVLVNKIIDFAIKDFAAIYLPEYKQPKQPAASVQVDAKIERMLKQIRATVEDTHVMYMVIERMVATLYNTKAAELKGEKVSVEEFSTGMLTDLPAECRDMEQEIVQGRVRRLGVADE
ncbi:MAG: hypothetical protein NC133_04525 [Prevotella sp.]|nr:hypothetical protein [Prevotella sp.]